MLKKIFFAGCLLVTSMVSHAAVISYNGYERDDSSDIVKGGGLEWLKWDVTKGKSINMALSEYASLGWKLASNAQMATLFNTFQFGSDSWLNVENTTQIQRTAWNASESTTYNMFISLFGVTKIGTKCVTGMSYCYDHADPYIGAVAFYGSDNNNDNKYKLASIVDDYTVREYTKLTPNEAEAYLALDYILNHWQQHDIGVALVRAQPNTAVPVSGPASLGLLALGLIALGFRRR